MTLAANALTTADQLRFELGLEANEGDTTQLESRINRASALIASYLGAPLHYEAGIVERVAGFGTSRLTLTRRPVRAIASIVLYLGAQSETVSADAYRIEQAQLGFVERVGGLWAWTTAGAGLEPNGVAGQERLDYAVTYAGGWITPAQAGGALVRDLPEDIEAACLALAVLSWRSRGRDPSVKERKLMSATIKYGSTSDEESGALAQLDHYKRWA